MLCYADWLKECVCQGKLSRPLWLPWAAAAPEWSEQRNGMWGQSFSVVSGLKFPFISLQPLYISTSERDRAIWTAIQRQFARLPLTQRIVTWSKLLLCVLTMVTILAFCTFAGEFLWEKDTKKKTSNCSIQGYSYTHTHNHGNAASPASQHNCCSSLQQRKKKTSWVFQLSDAWLHPRPYPISSWSKPTQHMAGIKSHHRATKLCSHCSGSSSHTHYS